MKIIIARIFGVLLFIATLNIALNVSAVSYQPPLYHRQDAHETLTRGDTVYLFHSGTADVKKTIRVNDVVVVYRIDSSCRVTQVGQIRILSYVGGTYLKGEVLEGEIKRDDIAKKGDVSCLVISAGLCDH
jgi:predicted DNA binding protein